MTDSSDALSSLRRRVRLAGYAGLIWLGFQLVVLALKGGEDAWAWRGLVVNFLPVLILTAGVLRGNLLAALALGAYGILRFAMAVFALTRLMSGTVSQSHPWLPWEIGAVILVALVWISGGLAAYRLFRRTDPPVRAQEPGT